jgi:hypothetical protein
MVREALRQFKQIDLLFDRTSRAEHSRGMGRMLCLAGIAGAWLVGTCNADADGCFVFHWNKGKDINEPTQKVIILHDNGREDMVLQVKYEGPTEDFGWLIPVPGLPEVRKGSRHGNSSRCRAWRRGGSQGDRGQIGWRV